MELRNDPLCPARIFEIERDGATTAYDLLLLLALFFHRYALQVRILIFYSCLNCVQCVRIINEANTVEPRLTATPLIRSPG